jgi:signal transduction histidine kinase
MCIKVDDDEALRSMIDSRVEAPGRGRLRALLHAFRELRTRHLKRGESALLVQRLEDVARASGDWIWETDDQHRYTWVHDALAYAQTGVRAPRVGHAIPAGVIVNWMGEPELPLRDLHSVLRQAEPIVRLVTREDGCGGPRYVSRSAVPLLNADGTLRGYRGSARDVTQSLVAKAQLWRRDELLRRAKEQAEASSQAKSVLVSKVGHELRTPLNAIIGLAQLIQAGGGTGGNARLDAWIDEIARAGWHMVDVLDLLMELGRAGTEKASLSNKPVDAVEAVRAALGYVERDAKARAIDISFEGRAPVWVGGDRRAVCQVVLNLLSNAIKYNRAGGRVRVRVTPGAPPHIVVQDTGPGMNEEQLSRLYRPFDRLGMKESDVKGHGLGLLICKELVASMDGSMSVHSTVGQGTTFTVTLPTSRAAEPEVDAAGRCASPPDSIARRDLMPSA